MAFGTLRSTISRHSRSPLAHFTDTTANARCLFNFIQSGRALARSARLVALDRALASHIRDTLTF
ncbi:hypothetical protein Tcan_11876 [Toxocara canis]|uniref:Uncharacterized protein n=1 Tax=Toxocara canis TaxID=6265 RepID=A0A0B2VP61_TOXCA|nr:hypothetical protein Tcan_11876 [Toxocara canis]